MIFDLQAKDTPKGLLHFADSGEHEVKPSTGQESGDRKPEANDDTPPAI